MLPDGLLHWKIVFHGAPKIVYMSSYTTQPKIDMSLDEDFGEHSVSQIISRRGEKGTKVKHQPWKGAYKVDPTDVPSTMSLHDKPWYKTEHLDAAYEDHSGA
ncbi:hypothetical protein FPOA_08882 [Fusarium poae]|uniref:Uncharacterized protein n=1 Tax=Fusarium poae TaxID=36050 RepID=A0A1B8APW1_FUSPO|nr:hypothetical protein FPOA_08882 [Fusarium poae]